MKEDKSIKRIVNTDMPCDITKLNQYLIERARHINEAIKAAREEYRKRFNTGFYVGDILSFMVSPEWAFKDNLDNLLSIAKGNTIAGIFLEHNSLNDLNKVISKDNKIDELDKLCYRLKKQKEEEARLKMMAFLFIIRNGFEDEFCAFNANYHGNVKEDLQREFERIYGNGARFN